MSTFRTFSIRAALCLLALFSLSGYTQTPPPDEAGAQITQVDTSQFPEVVVYVSVTNTAGAPVVVSPSQITLMENGQPVEPEDISAAGEIGPLATLLVIDTSGSMNSGGKLEAARSAARAYVEQAREDDLIGVLSFNTEIDYIQPLTHDRQKLLAAIDNLKAREDTAMYDALATAVELIGPIDGRKAIIVMTDGLDNRSKANPIELAQSVGSQGLTVSTIGLGDPSHSQGAITSLDEAGLKALAREAGGEYGYASDAASLKDVYQRFGRALQSEYRITYTSPSALRDGVNRALSVSLASGAAAGPVSFNPGGLVPEVVKPAPWWVFAAALAGLLLLLAVPLFFRRVILARREAGQDHSPGRIRMEKPEPAPKRPRAGGGNVKLKS
jgi:VWFA-related protein